MYLPETMVLQRAGDTNSCVRVGHPRVTGSGQSHGIVVDVQLLIDGRKYHERTLLQCEWFLKLSGADPGLKNGPDLGQDQRSTDRGAKRVVVVGGGG